MFLLTITNNFEINALQQVNGKLSLLSGVINFCKTNLIAHCNVSSGLLNQNWHSFRSYITRNTTYGSRYSTLRSIHILRCRLWVSQKTFERTTENVLDLTNLRFWVEWVEERNSQLCQQKPFWLPKHHVQRIWPFVQKLRAPPNFKNLIIVTDFILYLLRNSP